ncbi:MAG: sulfotransferase domain-containing protein [Flavobacteriales bacterium]|nr:sulfotransferase domain-containing protein [Flavobacteriales bacterium]
MKNFFIHIGMPRTGTTFLQKKVFPNIEGFNSYSLPYSHYNEAFHKMIYMDDSLYDEEEFLKEVRQFKGENVILSNENFIGQSLFYYHSNRTRIAQRLHKAMPNATIILYLRNQIDILKSLYLITVSWKESKSLDEFVWTKRDPYTINNYHDGNLNYGEKEGYYSTFETHERLDGYIYNNLIELYKDLFPNVEIILYEDFINDPVKVQKRLENIFSCNFNETVSASFKNKEVMNQGVNKRQAVWLSKINKWQDVVEDSDFNSRALNRLKRWVKNNLHSDKELEFSAEVRQEIVDFYRPYNQALAKKYPELELENYAKEYLL